MLQVAWDDSVLEFVLFCSAGFDLSSAYDITVPKKGKAIIKTDLSVAIPPETYARIGNFAIDF
jgi:dUTPase